MPLLKKKRVLAAKIESTPGTAESLSASDAVFNVYDATIQPSIEFDNRDGQGEFAPLYGTLGAYGATCTFSTDVIGDNDPLPAWASTFLPACGLVWDTTKYETADEAPGTNVKTLTIGLYEDGLFKSMRGAMGNVVFRFDAGKRIVAEFTFTGIWVAPSDVAVISPTYPTTAPIRFVSSSLAIGSWSPKVASMTIDLGNEVILREDSSNSSGYSTAIITGRRVNGEIDPESSLVADDDPYGDWLSLTEASLSCTCGSSGNQAAFTVEKAQFTTLQEGERNGLHTDAVQFQGNRNAGAFDFTLGLS
jgi:hypothetical protein